MYDVYRTCLCYYKTRSLEMTLFDRFKNDPMGKRFGDVMNDDRFNFKDIVRFFEVEARQHRMASAQIHFKTPALGGVVVEMEGHPAFSFLKEGNKFETIRLRQAIGVLTKVVMESMGWKKTGKKGSLCSLTKYFTSSEIYTSPAAH